MTTLRHWLSVSCLVLLPSAVCAQTLSIRADVWYPINGEPGSDKQGFMIDIAREILAEKGIKVDYQNLPWERALRSVRDGTYDCVVGAYKEDAPDFVFPEQEWGFDLNMFYVAKNEPWRYSDLASLQGTKVGLIGGYAYAEVLQDYIDANPDSPMFEYVNANNALEQNIKKVIGKRITSTVESKFVMGAKLKEMGMADQIVPAGQLGEEEAMYIACSPAKESSQQYVQWFDEGIDKLRKTGRLADIMVQYGLTDWR